MTAAEARAVHAEHVQTKLNAVDSWYQGLFGNPDGWSESVHASYRVDLHLARQMAGGWQVAA